VTTGNGHKLLHKKLHLDVRKSLFAIRMIKRWKKLPREVMESLLLELYRTILDRALDDLLYDWIR